MINIQGNERFSSDLFPAVGGGAEGSGVWSRPSPPQHQLLGCWPSNLVGQEPPAERWGEPGPCSHRQPRPTNGLSQGPRWTFGALVHLCGNISKTQWGIKKNTFIVSSSRSHRPSPALGPESKLCFQAFLCRSRPLCLRLEPVDLHSTHSSSHEGRAHYRGGRPQSAWHY